MSKVLRSALSFINKSTQVTQVQGRNLSTLSSKSRYLGCSPSLHQVSGSFSNSVYNGNVSLKRNHCSLSTHKLSQTNRCRCVFCVSSRSYSSEVDTEMSAFLAKEIKYESAKAPKSLPVISGFEIATDGGDVTLTKSTGTEKIVIRMSVNGAVDSIVGDGDPAKEDDPPEMACRPPFEVEISKGDGQVLAFQCAFPSVESPEQFEDAGQKLPEEQQDIEDQFEIQEVAIHNGEWKNQTYTVSAATLDAELFDLLMDMLDERGINDEFIAQLVDYCTAYENQNYIGFLNDLNKFVTK